MATSKMCHWFMQRSTGITVSTRVNRLFRKTVRSCWRKIHITTIKLNARNAMYATQAVKERIETNSSHAW